MDMNGKLGTMLALFAVLAGAVVFADGAGGIYYGLQTSEYPFLKDYPVRNNSLGLACYGGFGYGVHGNTITGGFGFAVGDTDGDTGISGGFGGVINGVRFVDWPVTISLISWTAIGGISAGNRESEEEDHGFFAFMEEITLEVGIPINRWFMPSLYAGYQVAGNLAPGTPFEDFLVYTPVVGVRVAWGKFY
jgi:hypothetical protein